MPAVFLAMKIGSRELCLKITDTIFIHIPKTGGTSVVSALGPKIRQGHNTSLKVIQNLGQRRWDECFKFAFVRNPWDYAVSWYEFHKEFFRTNARHITCSSFGSWVLDGMETHWGTDWRTKDQPNDPLNIELFLHDDLYVGKFETLQDDFNIVCDKIDVKRIELPFLNQKAERPDYRTYYNNDKIIELVRQRNKYVIERFDYEF